MAFGKRKAAQEPPAVPAVVDWRSVREFEITSALWRPAKKRKKVEEGQLAVRIPLPVAGSDDVPLVPCAFFSPKVRLSTSASRVYTDEAAEQVLLSVQTVRNVGEGEKHYHVRDAAGTELGLIRRIPPATRLQRHNWRMQQPGRPEMVARKQRRRRPHGRGLIVDLAANMAGVDEGGDFNQGIRTLEWRADDELVMTSRAFGPVEVHVDWLDRRLAIAFAMLLDR